MNWSVNDVYPNCTGNLSGHHQGREDDNSFGHQPERKDDTSRQLNEGDTVVLKKGSHRYKVVIIGVGKILKGKVQSIEAESGGPGLLEAEGTKRYADVEFEYKNVFDICHYGHGKC